MKKIILHLLLKNLVSKVNENLNIQLKNLRNLKMTLIKMNN